MSNSGYYYPAGTHDAVELKRMRRGEDSAVAGQRHDFALTVDSEDINAAEGCHISSLARSDAEDESGFVPRHKRVLHGEVEGLEGVHQAIKPGSQGSLSHDGRRADWNSEYGVVGEERQTGLAEVTSVYMEGYPVLPIVHMPLFWGLAENLNWTPRLDGFILVKEMSYS